MHTTSESPVQNDGHAALLSAQPSQRIWTGLRGLSHHHKRNGVALKWKERQNPSSAVDIRKVDLMGLLGCVQNGSKRTLFETWAVKRALWWLLPDVYELA